MLTEYFTQEPVVQLGPKFKEFQRAHIFEGEGRAHEDVVLKPLTNWNYAVLTGKHTIFE